MLQLVPAGLAFNFDIVEDRLGRISAVLVRPLTVPGGQEVRNDGLGFRVKALIIVIGGYNLMRFY